MKRGFLVLALVLLTFLVGASGAKAQGSGCVKCAALNQGCLGAGDRCCCNARCTWNDAKHSVTCTCTKWCNRCGICVGQDCDRCTSANDLEPANTQLASTSPSVALGDQSGRLANAKFELTDAGFKALDAKSPLVAAILSNLTTTCRSVPKQRITLTETTDSPFEGGVTVTSQDSKGATTSFTYAGRITVRDRRVILDVEYRPRPEARLTKVHAEVPETGDPIVRETSE